jgi:DNA-binding beta-propeller fold protein YncE
MRRGSILLLATVFGLLYLASPATAYRALQTEQVLPDERSADNGGVEDACGLAVAPDGDLYVSDYYHGSVDRYTEKVEIEYRQGGPDLQVGTHPEGPCGLALDSAGRLYVNLWHQSALRVKPSVLSFDHDHVTGIAVDPATDYLYVDHHNFEHQSFVSVYLPSGLPLEEAGQPVQIGLGSLGDAYGVAAFSGRVYVADASDEEVKVYEPSIDADQPIFSIAGFNSLTDASLAVDPTNAHLLVVDNTQPGYESPIAIVLEFDSDGSPLGYLPGKPVFGKPSGIAVDPSSGELYVTDGNSEYSNVFVYGPYSSVSPAATLSPLASVTPAASVDAMAAAPAVWPRPESGTAARPLRRHRKHRPHRRHTHKKAGGRR